jgi:hypothetical protein
MRSFLYIMGFLNNQFLIFTTIMSRCDDDEILPLLPLLRPNGIFLRTSKIFQKIRICLSSMRHETSFLISDTLNDSGGIHNN